MNPNSWGVYILQTYASVAGQSAPDVVAGYTAEYGDEALASLGQVGASLSADQIKSAMHDVGTVNFASVVPSRASLNSALLNAAGFSTVKALSNAVSETASEIGTAAEHLGSGALTALKYAAVLLVVIGIGYIAFQVGLFKNVKRAS